MRIQSALSVCVGSLASGSKRLPRGVLSALQAPVMHKMSKRGVWRKPERIPPSFARPDIEAKVLGLLLDTASHPVMSLLRELTLDILTLEF